MQSQTPGIRKTYAIRFSCTTSMNSGSWPKSQFTLIFTEADGFG